MCLKKNHQKQTEKEKKIECFLKGRSIFGFTDKAYCDTQQERWSKLEQSWKALSSKGFQNLEIWLCFKWHSMIFNLHENLIFLFNLNWSNTSFGQNSRFQPNFGIQDFGGGGNCEKPSVHVESIQQLKNEVRIFQNRNWQILQSILFSTSTGKNDYFQVLSNLI